MKAVAFEDEKKILAGGVTEESAAAYARDVADSAVFQSNLRAGAEYRKKICEVLVRRAALALREV